ncbi:MAG: hypothetical protein DCF22_03670 [Leptolyngbya sp.]|nr:MAG: hypothetical protein DCF22_03670 [Leptolyngbya sp.]
MPLFPESNESDELESKQLLERFSNIDFANESTELKSESKQLLERIKRTNNIDSVKQPRTLYSYMSESPPEGEVREASILFVNLYGVDRLTQHMKTATRVELLNHFFEVMVTAIFENRGTLDKYIGSAIMAVFNSPLPLEDHALMAIKTALAMRDRLPDVNSHWFPDEQQPLTIGIGINTDQVFCGDVGSSKRMEFTAVGHGVNVANHLSQQSPHYGCDILIGQKTYQSCAESIQVRERDSTQLKPEGTRFNVYELIGLLDAT